MDLATKEDLSKNALLAQAQSNLTEALINCRSFHLLGIEPDILLTLARFHFIQSDLEQAWEYAKEALMMADDGKYRLKQADIYILMAQMAYKAKDLQVADQYAQSAYNYALCDGPLCCYKSTLDTAEQLLHQSRK